MAKLQPMVEGGRWLRFNGNPHYITHEAHVKRLLTEGAEPISDPRVPVESEPEPAAAPAPAVDEDAYKQRIAELEALLEAKNAAENAGDEKPASRRGAK